MKQYVYEGFGQLKEGGELVLRAGLLTFFCTYPLVFIY